MAQRNKEPPFLHVVKGEVDLQRYDLAGVSFMFRCLCKTDRCNKATTLDAFLRLQALNED